MSPKNPETTSAKAEKKPSESSAVVTRNSSSSLTSNYQIALIVSIPIFVFLLVGIMVLVTSFNLPQKSEDTRPDALKALDPNCWNAVYNPNYDENCEGKMMSDDFYHSSSSSFSRDNYKNQEFVYLDQLPSKESKWSKIYDNRYINQNNNENFQVLLLDNSRSGENKYVKNLPNLETPAFEDVRDQDSFENVQAKNLAIYYYGYLKLEKEERIAITAAQSWAETRVFINDKLALETKHHGYKEMIIPKGEHTIRIEFTGGNNNGHYITFDEAKRYIRLSEALKNLPNNFREEYDFYIASVYESKTEQSPVTINLPKSGKPVYLLLNSNESVNWEIRGEGASDVKQVMVYTNQKGSKVTTPGINTDLKVDYVSWEDRILKIDYQPNVILENQGVENLFKKKPDGFAGEYNPLSLEFLGR